MKKLTVSLLALITILLSTPAQAQINDDQARNYQINASHNGSVYTWGLVPPLKPMWTVNFGQPISYPLIANGKVFVTVRLNGTVGTKLYALDGATGATVWGPIAISGGSSWSALCYENGRVFTIGGDGALRAFDAANGNAIWVRQLPGQYSFTSAPTAFQGVIYTGGSGSGGTVYAVSAATGDVLWTASVTNGDQSSPAVTSDSFFVSYSCPVVYRLNPANGALIWRYYPGCSGGGGKTPALYNGRLYVRDSSGDKIFDSQTGTITGTFVAKNIPAFAGNMGFFLNGPKYFGSFGTLEGRDLTNNNSVVWSFAGDGFLQSSLLVVNDYVYVGSDKGKLYAVDAATGQQVWTANVGVGIPYVDEHNSSQPLTGFAAGEGILVVPTKTTLVAYGGDSAPTLSWGSQTPAANAYGWNNTAVDVSFTTSDDLPGVVSTPESPLHFTSEGANQTQQVTVTDTAGQSETFTSPPVNIDLSSPVTALAPSGTMGNGEWYAGTVQISLTASDSVSSIANTFYKIDSGATETYLAPFTISTDGSHSIEYWSVDAAGNTEAQQSAVVKVDASAPTSEASVSGTPSDNGWYQNPTQVALTASDGASGVANSYYTVDGGTTQTYAGPFSVAGDGSHVINYWSVDAAGNAESQLSLTVKVDGSAPNTQSSVSGLPGNNGWYISPTVQVSLTGSDSHSGIATSFYSIDGGAAQTYAGSFTVSGNAEHQVSFWSVDRVSNIEAQQSFVVKIDNAGPTTSNTVTGPVGNGVYFKGAVQFSLTAADNLSGVANTYYRIDNGPTQTYTAPFTVSGDGTHPVDYWSVDVAGNNTNSYTVNINIDTTAPLTVATPSGTTGTNGWYRGPVQVSLSASDSLSGVANRYYSVNGGATQTYSTAFTVSAVGTHTINFWSTDQATNTEAIRSLVVKIDASGPVITAAANPSSATKSNKLLSVVVSGRVTDTPSGVTPNSTTYSVVDEYGVTQPSGFMTLQANGNYSFNLSLPRTRNGGDSNGHLYTITVRSNDQAGNADAASTTVKIL